MRGAAVERFGLQCRDEPDHSGDRVLGELRIGDMALLAVHDETAGERAAPPDLDHVAESLGVRRLAEDAMVEALALRLCPIEQLDGAVDGRTLLVAGDEKADRAGEIRMPGEVCQRRRHHAGDAALHVGGAAAEELAAFDDAAERVVAPARDVARRHDVGVTCEHEVRVADPEAGIEVLDVRRPFGRKHRPVHLEAGVAEHLRDEAQRATLRRRDRGAADQGLREGERRVVEH